jgi:hypothetical protein
MLDKEKLKAKREKEMEDTLNIWQALLNDNETDSDNKKEPIKDKK